MTQGMGKKIGHHYVVCGAVKTTTGMFAPIFRVHEGDTSSGKLVHQQDFLAPSPNFSTEQEAFDAAADMAAKWIASISGHGADSL